MEKPIEYYENNFVGSINLIHAMAAGGCKTLVFSSSCTVYGMVEKVGGVLALGGFWPVGTLCRPGFAPPRTRARADAAAWRALAMEPAVTPGMPPSPSR